MTGDFQERGGGGRFRFREPGTGVLTQRLVELGHLGVVPARRLRLVAAMTAQRKADKGRGVKIFALLPPHPRTPPAGQGVIVQNDSTYRGRSKRV